MISPNICAVCCGVVCKELKMPNSVDFSGKPFHFIGIGGIGMSALAYVLAKRKLPVSGSDIRSSHITQRLSAIGSHIFIHKILAIQNFFCLYLILLVRRYLLLQVVLVVIHPYCQENLITQLANYQQKNQRRTCLK